ncbi:MAG: hypothetical protein QM785_07795 [Pyrinomonadaceae bacterium]
MKKSALHFLVLFYLLMIGGLSTAPAQTFDISSGGTPTLSGSQGGSIVGSSSTVANLNVTINWGEVSPSNTNGLITATVPVAIRSLAAYQISVSVTGGTNVDPQALQRSDIGFGLNRTFTSMGALSRTCSTSDTFNAAISANPATGITTNAAGRTTYVSSLATITNPTVVLSGPQLSTTTAGRRTDNGWILTFYFVMTPQFYAAGTTTTTVTLSIGSGPALVC